MTTRDLGPELERDDDALAALFESSPAREVRTSAAAVVAFIAGLVALVGSPFSLMLAVCLALGVVGVVGGIVGLARASRPDVAGGLLASVGLLVSLLALLVVGLRYLGLDTAVADGLGPTLADWLRALNDVVQ
jgi:hypothetical protein